MAIQQNIEEGASQFGVAFNNAYYRIAGMHIHRTDENQGDPKFVVSIDLMAYVTTSPHTATTPVDVKGYVVDIGVIEATAGDTFLDKCYAWIMTQDDMSGSTAV